MIKPLIIFGGYLIMNEKIIYMYANKDGSEKEESRIHIDCGFNSGITQILYVTTLLNNENKFIDNIKIGKTTDESEKKRRQAYVAHSMGHGVYVFNFVIENIDPSFSGDIDDKVNKYIQKVVMPKELKLANSDDDESYELLNNYIKKFDSNPYYIFSFLIEKIKRWTVAAVCKKHENLKSRKDLRSYQEDTIKCLTKAIARQDIDFLMNLLPRSGKTIISLYSALEAYYKNPTKNIVLYVCGMSDPKYAVESELHKWAGIKKAALSDEIVLIDSLDLKKDNELLSIATSSENQGKLIFVIATLADIGFKISVSEKINDDDADDNVTYNECPKLNGIENYVNVIYFDECHRWYTDATKKFFNNYNANKVFMTGTASKFFMSGIFNVNSSNVYIRDDIDILNEINAGYATRKDYPTIKYIAKVIKDDIAFKKQNSEYLQFLKDDNDLSENCMVNDNGILTFSYNAFFEVKSGKFTYESAIKGKMLRLFHTCENLPMSNKRPVKNILIRMPNSIAKITVMASLLKSFFGTTVNVFSATGNCNNEDLIQKFNWSCKRSACGCDENYNIILTCGKLCQSITYTALDLVVNMSDMKSLDDLVQLYKRPATPELLGEGIKSEKEYAYVLDEKQGRIADIKSFKIVEHFNNNNKKQESEKQIQKQYESIDSVLAFDKNSDLVTDTSFTEKIARSLSDLHFKYGRDNTFKQCTAKVIKSLSFSDLPSESLELNKKETFGITAGQSQNPTENNDDNNDTSIKHHGKSKTEEEKKAERVNFFQRSLQTYIFIKLLQNIKYNDVNDFQNKLDDKMCESIIGISAEKCKNLLTKIYENNSIAFNASLDIAYKNFENVTDYANIARDLVYVGFSKAIKNWVPKSLADRMIGKYNSKFNSYEKYLVICGGINLLPNCGQITYIDINPIFLEIVKAYAKQKNLNVNCILATEKNIVNIINMLDTFDKTLMNPPYDKSLHLKILEETLNHITKTGKIVNLSPIRWLQDPLAEYKQGTDFKRFENIRKHIENIDIIDTTTAKKLFNAGIDFDLGIYSMSSKELKVFGCLRQNKILDKVYAVIKKNNIKLLSDVEKKESSSFSLKMPYIHGHNGTADFIEVISPQYDIACNSAKTGMCNTFIFNKNENERKHLFKSFFTNFYKYLNLQTKSSMRVVHELPFMGDCINPRTCLKGYESEWTDQDFYKFFNLTPEEIATIETTMKDYK